MRKEKPFEYNVTLTEKHMDVLIKALDAYCRLGLGQFKYVIEHMFPMDINRDDIQPLIDTLHVNLLDMPVNGSRGIGGKDVPEKANIAYEIGKTLEHHRSWKKHPEGGYTTNYGEPLKVSEEPMVKISDVKKAAKPTTKKEKK